MSAPVNCMTKKSEEKGQEVSVTDVIQKMSRSLQNLYTPLFNTTKEMYKLIDDSMKELNNKYDVFMKELNNKYDELMKKEDSNNLINEVKTNIDSQTNNLSELIGSQYSNFKELFNDKINNLDNGVSGLSNQINEISTSMSQFSTYFEKIDSLGEKIEEIKGVVDLIYEPSAPVSINDYSIKGVKLPNSPPEFKERKHHEGLLSCLLNFKEQIQKQNLLGSELKGVINSTKDGVVTNLTQRGPLINFFVQLQHSLNPYHNEVLSDDFKKTVIEEIDKTYEFYNF